MHRIKSIGRKQLVSLVTLAVVVVLIISTVILYYFVGRPVNVIVVGKTSDISIQFWQDLHEGFAVAAKEFGVDYKYLAPPTEQDIDTQISLLNYAVSQKPDVIILIAADHTRLKQAAQNVVDNHIGLITLDSDVDIDPGDKTFVSTNNFAAGQTAAGKWPIWWEAEKRWPLLPMYPPPPPPSGGTLAFETAMAAVLEACRPRYTATPPGTKLLS